MLHTKSDIHYTSFWLVNLTNQLTLNLEILKHKYWLYRPFASDSLYSIPTLYFSTKGIHTDSILFNIQYITYFESSLLYYLLYSRLSIFYFFVWTRDPFQNIKVHSDIQYWGKKPWWLFLINFIDLFSIISRD